MNKQELYTLICELIKSRTYDDSCDEEFVLVSKPILNKIEQLIENL